MFQSLAWYQVTVNLYLSHLTFCYFFYVLHDVVEYFIISWHSTMCSHTNVLDVSPHPILRSGQPCPLDWLAPSPTTVAALVSCRASRPKDEWCDLSKAGVPRGWESGSSCCWGSACCCCLRLIPDPASSGPSHTYLRSKQSSSNMTLVGGKLLQSCQCIKTLQK